MFLNAYKKDIQATILLLFFITSLIASAKELYAHEINIDNLITDIQKDDWHSRLPLYGGAEGVKNDRLTDALIDLVENKMLNWRYRIRAIQLLGESKKEKALNFLERILSDPFLNHDCPAIKWNAVTALGNFAKDQRAADILLDASKFEDNPVVREAIVKTMGRVGSSKAVPFLISILNDKSFAIKINAVKALGEIGDESAIPFVKQALDNDTDPHIRDEAAKALRRLNAN
jgi:HEAT repeat protein